jgi:cell fate (sporulation/competence/biofilm development) regulator YlbF (YheA/YmcA/DUF963 family)
MDILEKAKELGGMIAESAEMAMLKGSEIEIQCDGCSQKLLGEYKELQLELVRARSLSDRVPAMT